MTDKQPDLIPREVLFGNPERTSVRLSPDGKQLGYIAPREGVLNVWVQDMATGEARPITSDNHRGIRMFMWAYDGKSLCYIQDKDGDENWHLYAVDIATSEVRALTPFEGVQAHLMAASPELPNQMLVTMNKDDAQLHDVYRITLSTGELQKVMPNPGDVVAWDSDRKLQVRGGTALTPDGGSEIRGYDPDKGQWRTLMTVPFGETAYIIGVTPDDRRYYIMSSLDSNTTRVLILDPETGEQEVVASRDDVDFDGSLIMHPKDWRLQGVSFTKARQEWTVVDPELRPDFLKASKACEGEFDIVSRTLADDLWITAFSRDVGPVQYYLYDKASGDSRFLFSQRPELDRYTLAPMEPVEIPTRDGLTMVCYLTLPVGNSQKPLPMVLNVHGGPWSRDGWGYDPEAQWLANRGYAVLQVNYRGSTGFGKAYVNAANKEWGGKMHDDLVDAVHWAIERGIADRDRVAIFGGSYGGYATLVGMTFTPEVFCAGVDIVGISNLISWYHSIPPYWEPFRNELNLRVGNADTEAEFMRSRSPLFKVDNIVKPLLIAQGANDPRVPRAEAEQMVEALQSRGIPVEYMLFEDEGHGFARPENRLKFYAAAERFLAGVLGGRVQG